MKVIFLQSVINVADAGEIKEVSDGYARNYLLPKKLAAAATASATAIADMQKRIKVKQEAVEAASMRELAGRIEGKEIVIRAKAGEKGKLFGSVGTSDIAEELQRQVNTEIDKRKIELAEPIKQLGTYSLEIKLFKDVNPKFKVNVEAEAAKEGTAEPSMTVKEQAKPQEPGLAETESPDEQKPRRKKKETVGNAEAGTQPEPEAKKEKTPRKKKTDSGEKSAPETNK